jgi:hypothetical protein
MQTHANTANCQIDAAQSQCRMQDILLYIDAVITVAGVASKPHQHAGMLLQSGSACSGHAGWGPPLA